MVRSLLTLAVLAGGCWSEEPLIHDAFTPDQWARLQQQFAPLETPDPCKLLKPAQGSTIVNCDYVAGFGQQMFFEPRLSGPWVYDPVLSPKLRIKAVPAAKTSCATCHDPKAWFIDTRPDSAVSLGAVTTTKHNTISVVNTAVEYRELYTWSGQCTDKEPCLTTQNVVHDIALPNAMKSDAAIVGRLVRNTPSYELAYRTTFGQTAPKDDKSIQQNVEVALDAYMRRLVSLHSPFDDFMDGDDDALSAEAKRGFVLFVGRAMCVECHGGPMFSDGKPHVTGVQDQHPDKPDTGYANTGAFFTPSLRHVAGTAPYMHNGSLKTLGEVLDFYRWGGNGMDYFGDKDPLMAPFEMSEQDKQDLAAFLRALTGKQVVDGLTRDTHSTQATREPEVTCPLPMNNTGLVCGGVCRDIATDVHNCGACGNDCGQNAVCVFGTCVPQQCPMTQMLCNGNCIDTQSDPGNCGGCGNTCMAGQTCVAGMCQTQCTAPLESCGGSCVNTQIDLYNCGTCGQVCMPGQACVAGACQMTTCPMPLQPCNSTCTSFATDPQNCGACGNACPTNKPNCVSGMCRP